MSRAPAPMALEASTVPANATPYDMRTFASMPNQMMPQYPMGGTAASPMHAMQNMYTNMQQPPQPNPYGMQQPYVGQQSPNPDGMPQPLVGQQSPNPYGMPQPLVGQGQPGMQNVSVLDFKPDVLANQQAAQLQQQYNARMNSLAAAAHPSLGVIGPDGRYMAATAATPGGMSPRFSSGPYDSVGASAPQNGSWGSHGLHSYSTPQSNSSYNNTPRRSMNPSYTHRDTSSMATRAALKDLVDERLQSVPSTRALKNIIEDHVDKAVGRKVSQIAPQAAAAPVVTSGFHTKPQEEQRRIVSDAVRSVMSKYNVTPKSEHDPMVGSRFDEDEDY